MPELVHPELLLTPVVLVHETANGLKSFAKRSTGGVRIEHLQRHTLVRAARGAIGVQADCIDVVQRPRLEGVLEKFKIDPRDAETQDLRVGIGAKCGLARDPQQRHIRGGIRTRIPVSRQVGLVDGNPPLDVVLIAGDDVLHEVGPGVQVFRWIDVVGRGIGLAFSGPGGLRVVPEERRDQLDPITLRPPNDTVVPIPDELVLARLDLRPFERQSSRSNSRCGREAEELLVVMGRGRASRAAEKARGLSSPRCRLRPLDAEPVIAHVEHVSATFEPQRDTVEPGRIRRGHRHADAVPAGGRGFFSAVNNGAGRGRDGVFQARARGELIGRDNGQRRRFSRDVGVKRRPFGGQHQWRRRAAVEVLERDGTVV